MFVESQIGSDYTQINGWIAQKCPEKCPKDCDTGWEYWDGNSWPVDPELNVICGGNLHFLRFNPYVIVFIL